ncbi:hypothetical protein H8D83_02195 [Candidatus Woesearchaeota archaeon]|nr:hypothetical protein [Candidatus Woesearchaeota archaeon]
MDISNIHKNIVIIGSFNPAIFQPTWISSYSLVPEGEMEMLFKEEITEQVIENFPDLKIQIGKGQPFRVSNNQAFIAFKSFTIQVDRNRITVVLLDQEKVAINFIKKIFKILNETPINAYGVNLTAQLSFTEGYNEIIDSLLKPKKHFIDSFGKEFELGFKFKTNKNNFLISNTIEKSTESNKDVYLASNFHKDIEGGAKGFNEQDLKNQYTECFKYFNSIIQNLGTIKK